MTSIYKLVFPNDERVYIGLTTRNPEQRLKQHLQMLNGGRHHSHKLQKVWPECGEPSIEILEICSTVEGPVREIYWISHYNSYNDGFNATAGGNSAGSGFSHYSAKYTEDDYTCIVFFLAYTNYTAKEVAEELDISVHVVTDILCQVNHTNLKNTIPIEYNMMLAQKRQGRSNIKDSWPSLRSPDGTVHSVTNANRFAIENNLNPSHLHSVLTGKRNSHFGWTLAEVPNANN